MTAVSPPSRDPRGRLEHLSNWLALLALLAGGVVFPGAREAAGTDSGAAVPAPCSHVRATTASSPQVRPTSCAGDALPRQRCGDVTSRALGYARVADSRI